VNFKDLSVSTKLIVGFATVLVMTVVLGLFGNFSMSRVNDAGIDVRSNWMPSIGFLGHFEYMMTRYRVFQGNYVMADSDADRDTAATTMQAHLADTNAAWATYVPTIATPEEHALVDKILAARVDYDAMNDKLQELSKTQNAAAKAFFVGPMKAQFSKLVAAIEADVKYNVDMGNASGKNGEDIYANARWMVVGAIGIAVLLGFAAGYILIRAISDPLKKMTEAMGELARGNLNADVPHADQKDEIGQLAATMTSFKNQLVAAEAAKAEQTKTIVDSIGAGLSRLAEGDLTHRVTADLTGAFAKLKDDFNTASGKLQETVQHVLETTDQISTGAGEISTAADDLSRRTEQQAASLEETAAALEEITASVKKSATNAKDAFNTVAQTRTVALESGRVVETAVRAMDAIAQSSKQITDITGVIDEIAFQTNLLALNAGVEAARAGDAGRGFAVVASEVRALAQRSGEAAKQIKTLINTSTTHVNDGVKYVGETGHALKRIVDQVTEISALAQGSAEAGEQQAAGIEEVNSAVAQMDQVTQQNAAMVEESTAASRNLAGETQTLKEIVSFFKVDEQRLAARAVQRPAPRPESRPAAKSPAPVRPQRMASGGRALAAKPNAAASEEWSEF